MGLADLLDLTYLIPTIALHIRDLLLQSSISPALVINPSLFPRMTKQFDRSSDGLPSYSESISSALPNNIASARTALISNLAETHIKPHLHSNALSGLSRTTLLVIPSNVSPLQPPQPSSSSSKGAWDSDSTFPGETIVGFPDDENLTLIRLQGQENSLGFWCQPAVVVELEQQLRSQLQREGHRIVGGNEMASPSSPTLKKSGSVFQRTASNAEWRTVERKSLRDGEASIEVGVKEICLRMENVMGLYETRTGKALNVRVEVGG